ncbi:MAG: hypothetical protein HY436_01595 [Candidatus Liptonbacteria bacterium]|nr:hypothetical protein [Candidatus Liptonbacteria bacterium]
MNPRFPPGGAVGAPLVAVGNAAPAGKYRNPPFKRNEVLEERPVAGSPMLEFAPKFVEDARLPPVSTTPVSILKFVEEAISAYNASGKAAKAKTMKSRATYRIPLSTVAAAPETP